jgi:uncharacterized protein YkwD
MKTLTNYTSNLIFIQYSCIIKDLEKAHDEEDEEEEDDDDDDEDEEIVEPYHISYHHNQAYDFDEPPLPVIPSPTIQTALALKSHPNNQLENSDLNQFRIESIEAHNNYRSRHDVQPLMHSDELSIYAQYWAEYVVNKNFSLF